MHRRRVRSVGLLAVIAVVAGCGMVSNADAPPVPFPECEADAFLFAGRSNLAALGLAEQWPEAAQRTADVWITAGPPDPADWPAPPGAAPMEGDHLLCVEFDDGSGMVGPISGWEPPGGAFEIGAATTDGAPLGGIVVIVAAVVVVGISILAFRRDVPRDDAG